MENFADKQHGWNLPYPGTMIRVTKLNQEVVVLNAELIRYIERCPDTLITLINGDTLMVRETLDEVVRRAVAYHQAKNLVPKPEYLPYREETEVRS